MLDIDLFFPSFPSLCCDLFQHDRKEKCSIYMEADDHEDEVGPNHLHFDVLLARSLLMLRSKDDVQLPDHYIQQHDHDAHKVQDQ